MTDFDTAVAAGMALFVKIQQHTEGLVRPAVLPPGWTLDIPSLFLLAIALTAVALGSWKEHTAVQIMLQVTLTCFSCLTLIWIGEAQYERAIRLYERLGFREVGRETRSFRLHGQNEFLRMERPA